ncbi:MAG: hypothetical protein J7515_13985 [Caulobacter sp.]|nr:hypothetical protein [Caulobacter sp.]
MAAADTPAYTMILDQSAHLDWDWIRTFAQNFWYYKTGDGVNEIIASGIQNAQSGDGAYYYTVCEMGFFRRFVETNPSQIAAIQALGDNFQIISGGVTSPDCQVCSGEGFIRNYLVGQTWLKATLGMTPKPHCWLPDDFGQGPELPALLTALGFVSVAFSRLPGTLSSCSRPFPSSQLTSNGLDFHWPASDGSSVIAHWLIDSYAFGNQLYQDDTPTPTAINTFVAAYAPTGASPPTYSGAATPYMYIPIDNDFSMPIPGLASDISQWNNNQVSAGATQSNVAVTQGTFGQFVQGLQQASEPLQTFAYNGSPYWTGYYASRPELKALHYETVRALIAAEVIGLLTEPSNATLNSMLPPDFWTRIDQAWTDFAPSTHHDYVCGTAPDPVYAGDQLPLLRGAAASARALRGVALNALAGMACGQAYGDGVIVANSLGFQRSGVAAIEGVAPIGTSITWGDDSTSPTQVTAEGGMLVYAQVPSFGYVTGTADQGSATPVDTVTLTPTTNGATSYTLSNAYLSATISAAADWGIESLVDVLGGKAEILSDTGNVIAFYDDSVEGDLYQFGNEYDGGSMPLITGVTVAVSGAGLGAVVLETGPLRARLRTEVEITVNGVATRFTREYALCADEPFLRMTTTGAAPTGTSVMASFPLASPVTTINHGVACHWTSVQPLSGFWGPPTFRATHDFLLPQDSNGTTLAAIYHASTPAWAFDEKGALIGCLLRNTPASGGHGASGSDPAAHTKRYALRVPTGLGDPETGQPLREAQAFHTPLLAAQMPSGEQYSGMLTANSASLASLPADSPAVLTVAKPGSYDPTGLVLRLYQPTNTTQTVVVSLPSAFGGATLVTASETAWSGGGAATVTGDTVSVEMVGAVATVFVEGLGRTAMT